MMQSTAVDWAGWYQRWDDQQQHLIPRREERFRVMLEVVAEVVGPEPRLVLDLACGTGAISARVQQRFPGVTMVAVDADPLRLAIGQHAHVNGDERLHWVRHDLRDPGWKASVQGHGMFDAVLTSTAMHWLGAQELLGVYKALGELVRPGGVYLNAEHLMLAPTASRFGALGKSVRQRLNQDYPPHPGDSWEGWWAAARSEPGFSDLLAQRERVFHDHPRHDEYITAQFHEEALLMAGFAETCVVWRYLDDTIVAAIR